MPKTRKHRRKWTKKYKKSINCRKPRGFSQKQYCKYGRTKKRVKKTIKGGSGALNASRKIGTALINGTRTIAKGIVDDATKQELLKQKYSREIGKNYNENVNPNYQFYDENKENFMNPKIKVDNNVISSKKSMSITPPQSVDFSDF
jgi:hypothetical protein